MNICDQLQTIGKQLRRLEQKHQRQPNSVRLLAVSKKQPSSKILQAHHCQSTPNQQLAFGENFVQEMLEKKAQLRECNLQWHFIGSIQSNKTSKLAEHADWIHSIDRLSIAERLNAQRPNELPPLSVCIQVNTSGETSKSGIPSSELMPLAQAVQKLPHIRLRGLMSMPAPSSDPMEQRHGFRSLRQLFERLNQTGLNLDTLSMGTTQDMESAIAEGSTLVRVGTAIFGERPFGLR